ncbi:MAG: hypothetical protein WD022_03645 [Balneolaceae bacterium]
MSANKSSRDIMPLYLFIALLTIFSACGLLGSDDKEPLEPGPRNYEWTVDTLYSPPGGFIYDIWGSSSDDVWAVAGGGLNNLWHFDGEEWSVWDERVGPSFYSIYGFAQDDVWMGGNDGKLYYFDGTGWTLAYSFDVEGAALLDINSIWGESTSNIYAAGTIMNSDDSPRGFILQGNDTNWGEKIITSSEVQLIRIRSRGKSVFSFGVNIHSDPDSMFFYKFEGRELKELFVTSSDEVYSISMNRIGESIHFVIEKEIYKYSKNKFNKWHTISDPNFGYQIYGRHKKDMFLRMNNGLAHYNGKDTKYLFDLDHSLLSLSNNAMIFEKEVFFIVADYDQGTNYIFHGILTENE